MSRWRASTGKVELDADADVAVEHGVTARRNERRGDLQVVIGFEGDVAAYLVFGGVFHGNRLVTGSGLGVVLLDAANERVRFFEREVAAQVDVVAERALLAAFSFGKTFQVGNLVADTDGEILRNGFDKLYRRNAQIEVAGVFVGEASRNVVRRREIDTQQRREALGDADGGDVERRRGYGKSRLRIFDKASVSADACPVEERGEAAHVVGAFVGVRQNETLENFLHLFQFRQSVVGDFPIRNQVFPRGECRQLHVVDTLAGVGGDEGGYQHVRRTRIDAAVGRVVGLPRQMCPLGKIGGGIAGVAVFVFEPLRDDFPVFKEAVEGIGMVAVVGREPPHRRGDGGVRHGEAAALYRGHIVVHEINLVVAAVASRDVERYFEAFYRFQHDVGFQVVGRVVYGGAQLLRISKRRKRCRGASHYERGRTAEA